MSWGVNSNAFGFDLQKLHHRGPDAFLEIDSRNLKHPNHFAHPESFRFKLGHARLSIIDLSEAANQPMSSEDEAYWLVFNGEIYNHAELRKELTARGHRFRTSHSDTEVLLNGLIEYGVAFLDRVNGMFAFVFIDRYNHSILAARDRMGIKPFFFRSGPGVFEFASEIRALNFPKEINLQAIRQYFHFLQTPGPITFYEDIFKLEAGEAIEWNGQGQFRKWVWWTPWEEDATRTRVSDDEMEELLKDSVRLRLQADVKVGTFLSGGLDSSLVTAIAAQQQPMSTFSFGFVDGIRDYKSELEHARIVSQHLGTKHHEVVATPQEYLDTLNRVFSILDEPIADTACGPLLVLSELAKDNGVTVMLGGEGADELFLGYRHWWDALRVYSTWHKIPKPLRPIMLQFSQRLLQAKKPSWNAWMQRINKGEFPIWGGIDSALLLEETKIFSADFLEATDNPYAYVRRYMFEEMPDESDFFQRLSSFDLRHRLPEQLLARIDRMSMAASVEARVPYLDHRIVEKALHMNVEQIGRLDSQKDILKRISSKYIPKSITNRPKDGFTIPLDHIIPSGRIELPHSFDGTIFARSYLRVNHNFPTSSGRDSWPLFALKQWLANATS